MWIDDQVFNQAHQVFHHKVWIPKEPIIVLGRSNDFLRECILETYHQNPIKVLRRYGGGGTVILHDGCVVLSIGCWVKKFYDNDFYFRSIHQNLIEFLGKKWPPLSDLKQKGISDLSFQDKKIAGTSLFRSKNYLLYQASFLVHARSELLEKYLAFPSKIPDYREGRSHSQFVMGLSEVISDLSEIKLCDYLETLTQKDFHSLGDDFLVNAPEDQFELIKKKIIS